MTREERLLTDALRDDLVRAYAVPPRRYHTFEHAREVAQQAARMGAGRAALLAAYAHDVIYVAGAEDNEARSAAWISERLADDRDVEEVARLVLVTARHDPDPHDAQGCLLSDADLAILAAGPAVYDDYVAAVRWEHRALADDAWRRGRGRFLADTLARPAIYSSVTGRALFEPAARGNLQRELNRLLSGADAVVGGPRHAAAGGAPER